MEIIDRSIYLLYLSIYLSGWQCLPTPGVFGIGRKEGGGVGGVVVLESGEDWFHIFDGFAFAGQSCSIDIAVDR